MNKHEIKNGFTTPRCLPVILMRSPKAFHDLEPTDKTGIADKQTAFRLPFIGFVRSLLFFPRVRHG